MKLYLSMILLFAPFLNTQCQRPRGYSVKGVEATEQERAPEKESVKMVKKTEEEWKAALTEKEYYVLRQHGTERAFTGDLLENKKKGTYTCAACGLPLFHSDTKFKSGTGWPSFWLPIAANYVESEEDESLGMMRIEVHCGRCKGHLGHVFPDGPDPTGLRYCINSVSLDFEEQ